MEILRVYRYKTEWILIISIRKEDQKYVVVERKPDYHRETLSCCWSCSWIIVLGLIKTNKIPKKDVLMMRYNSNEYPICPTWRVVK